MITLILFDASQGESILCINARDLRNEVAQIVLNVHPERCMSNLMVDGRLPPRFVLSAFASGLVKSQSEVNKAVVNHLFTLSSGEGVQLSTHHGGFSHLFVSAVRVSALYSVRASNFRYRFG